MKSETSLTEKPKILDWGDLKFIDNPIEINLAECPEENRCKHITGNINFTFKLTNKNLYLIYRIAFGSKLKALNFLIYSKIFFSIKNRKVAK